MSNFNELLTQFSTGNFVIVFDEHREQEGDFFVLAEHITSEKINFLFTHAKGMICTACDESIIQKLKLPALVSENSDKFGTNFHMSVDAAQGITTGVSASDRAKTIETIADPTSKPEDLTRPGHSFPLLAKPFSERFGHTEAAVGLARYVKKIPAVVICEILNEAGEKADKKELLELAKKWDTPLTTLEYLKKKLT